MPLQAYRGPDPARAARRHRGGAEGSETGPAVAGLSGATCGRSGGGRPDFAAVAKKVGVSESALMQALGGPPPDIEAAAKALNIDANVLREAMPKR